MKRSDLTSAATGTLVSIEDAHGTKGLAFLPDMLPVHLTLTNEIALEAEQASFALGQLKFMGSLAPNSVMFAQPFIRKEAVASTRIEGTRTDFEQLIRYEAEGSRAGQDPDSQEAENYFRALMLGWDLDPDRLTSVTTISELHHALMHGVRGQHRNPGRIRTIPVAIGGARDTIATARFVPPPPHDVPELLRNMTDFLTQESDLPRLIRIAILHYQFEAIHPFEDGNGRTGRLLIPLYMRYWGLLDQPFLYLSEYFERHRSEYVDRLYDVSVRGAWDEWILFFLNGVRVQANDAVARARKLLEVQDHLRRRYASVRSPYMQGILEALMANIAVTYEDLEQRTGARASTLHGLLRRLIDDQVVMELAGSRRNKVFVAKPVIEVILADLGNEG